MENRVPEDGYKFPAREYKDKRSKSGIMNRYCSPDWFKIFEFLSYSKRTDGLFCLACVLFPDLSHRRAKKLIDSPYSNWKDAKSDLKMHSTLEYHKNSMAKLNAFKQTYKNTSTRIDVTITNNNISRIQQNRESIKCILKCLEFCGRQGIALRGHRDDDTCSSFNSGNFKALLKFRVEAGDKTLSSHLESCKKNATYTSKTSQNELLLCIKEYLQRYIIQDVKAQDIGPYYSYQCDEVTDSSNWEQLGIVLRYSKFNQPVERLLEFIACEKITGEALCTNIIESLSKAGLDVNLCRFQTMDGAGNMAGSQSGCAARFTRENPKAVYIHCASHQLNLVLCKSCKVNEIHFMLDTLKQLGLFFKYSPKRSRRLEKAIEEVNKNRSPSEQIGKAKFKTFCETRWVEKQTTLQDFNDMYEPLLLCLEAIGLVESGWDSKTVCDAYGIMKRITDSTFIASFQIALHMFGYFKGLTTKLQGSTLDIIQGYEMVDNVKSLMSTIRTEESEYEDIFLKIEQMAKIGNVSLIPPRRCSTQMHRNNVPADTAKEYFKLALFYPFVDSILQEINSRFNEITNHAVQGLRLLPANLHLLDQGTKNEIFSYYQSDLPSAISYNQELRLWENLWQNEGNKPSSISGTLDDPKTCSLMYPNVTKILRLLLLAPLTTCEVERSNSTLRYIKNSFRSTMGEDRFNALILLYTHKDIELDYDCIIDMYARKHPRKMILINPLA